MVRLCLLLIYFDRTLLKFVVNMMKGEQDKESVEKPEILALPAPSLFDDSKPPPVQNGTPAVPTEDGMYVLRECLMFFSFF